MRPPSAGLKYSLYRACFVSQVTYRVIQVSDGQLEGQTDGAAAVSLVAGFPATSQTVTQVEQWRERRARSRGSGFSAATFQTCEV